MGPARSVADVVRSASAERDDPRCRSRFGAVANTAGGGWQLRGVAGHRSRVAGGPCQSGRGTADRTGGTRHGVRRARTCRRRHPLARGVGPLGNAVGVPEHAKRVGLRCGNPYHVREYSPPLLGSASAKCGRAPRCEGLLEGTGSSARVRETGADEWLLTEAPNLGVWVDVSRGSETGG